MNPNGLPFIRMEKDVVVTYCITHCIQVSGNPKLWRTFSIKPHSRRSYAFSISIFKAIHLVLPFFFFIAWKFSWAKKVFSWILRSGMKVVCHEEINLLRTYSRLFARSLEMILYSILQRLIDPNWFTEAALLPLEIRAIKEWLISFNMYPLLKKVIIALVTSPSMIFHGECLKLNFYLLLLS